MATRSAGVLAGLAHLHGPPTLGSSSALKLPLGAADDAAARCTHHAVASQTRRALLDDVTSPGAAFPAPQQQLTSLPSCASGQHGNRSRNPWIGGSKSVSSFKPGTSRPPGVRGSCTAGPALAAGCCSPQPLNVRFAAYSTRPFDCAPAERTSTAGSSTAARLRAFSLLRREFAASAPPSEPSCTPPDAGPSSAPAAAIPATTSAKDAAEAANSAAASKIKSHAVFGAEEAQVRSGGAAGELDAAASQAGTHAEASAASAASEVEEVNARQAGALSSSWMHDGERDADAPAAAAGGSSSEFSSKSSSESAGRRGAQELRGPAVSADLVMEDVADPGGQDDGEFVDFRELVQHRQDSLPSEVLEDGVTGQETERPLDTGRKRGKQPILRMESWKEMATWIDRFENSAALFPTELSRMWTQLVALHMQQGRGGPLDEKELIFPDAPIFSVEGREFLLRLTDACIWRLKMSTTKSLERKLAQLPGAAQQDAAAVGNSTGAARENADSNSPATAADATQTSARGEALPAANGAENSLDLESAPPAVASLPSRRRFSYQEYWERFRIRAPDAGRILWAAGKMKWRSAELVRAAEKVIIDDLHCEWNKPRYMTTAMWGVAWSGASYGLPRLAAALENVEPAFWEGMTVQNACNLTWSMAQMRHRPAQAFADKLQRRLLDSLQEDPASIHPQNIGDMLQGLATWRYPPLPGLVEASNEWMRKHSELLVANHVLAFLNGLAVMGILQQRSFLEFVSQLERIEGGRMTDAVALRVFVLAHCTQPDSEQPQDLPVTKYVKRLIRMGKEACCEVLEASASTIAERPEVRSITDVLSALGYSAAIAPDEVLANGDVVTPVLPELFVRRRVAPEDASLLANADTDTPEVGLQILMKSSCFRNKPREVKGEVLIAQRVLEAEGIVMLNVHADDWAELEDDDARQKFLRDLIGPVLAPGVPLPKVDSAAAEATLEGPELSTESTPMLGNGFDNSAAGLGPRIPADAPPG